MRGRGQNFRDDVGLRALAARYIRNREEFRRDRREYYEPGTTPKMAVYVAEESVASYTTFGCQYACTHTHLCC